MTTPSPKTLILVGGVLHLGILIASGLAPNVLQWRTELAKLTPLSRHVIWVHGAFITLTIIAFGLVSLFQSGALTAGTPLARCICGFIAAFWLIRLGIQFFLFDARPYLTRLYLKLGYHGLTVCFTYFVCVYGWAAIH
jgi:hypothetical protein